MRSGPKGLNDTLDQNREGESCIQVRILSLAFIIKMRKTTNTIPMRVSRDNYDWVKSVRDKLNVEYKEERVKYSMDDALTEVRTQDSKRNKYD